MNDPNQTTPIHLDEAKRLENMFPQLGEKLRGSVSGPAKKERAIKKLKDASKVLKSLVKTKFKDDPARSEILKTAARMVMGYADDIRHDF